MTCSRCDYIGPCDTCPICVIPTQGCRYRDTFELPGYFTLEDFDNLLERIREVGEADVIRTGKGSTRVCGFSIEADDLWDLCEAVTGVVEYLRSDGIGYIMNKDKIV